jgi:hypothetical protein
MHAFIDAVDLAAQVGKGGRVSHDGAVLGGQPPEIKENWRNAQRQSGLDEASTLSLSVDHRRGQFEPAGLQPR